jgi:hypothetical protein
MIEASQRLAPAAFCSLLPVARGQNAASFKKMKTLTETGNSVHGTADVSNCGILSHHPVSCQAPMINQNGHLNLYEK